MPKVRYLPRPVGDLELYVEGGRQQIVRRNWKFTILPRIALGVLVAILGFELLRQNMPQEGLWTLKLLGVAPAASLAGVLAGLLGARAQYARSLQPNLAFSLAPGLSQSLQKPAYTLHMMNAGPGMAIIESVRYSIGIRNDQGVTRNPKVTWDRAHTLLQSVGLQDGIDYSLELTSRGLPLPAVRQAKEGIELAAFTEKPQEPLTMLNIHVTIVDTLGDQHEKTVFLLDVMPDRPVPVLENTKVPPVLVPAGHIDDGSEQ